MISKDSFNSASTHVELSCIPDDATGIERIMLAAQGDLQRLMSSFFARPIFIERVYANGSPRLKPASPEHPITQSRQVHLVCASKIVCTATSNVTITHPDFERLFLDEKYPIGQTFRKKLRNPQFTLLDVQTSVIGGKRELRRTYTLETEGFLCEILEVFPDRDMFARGEAWLTESKLELENSRTVAVESQDTEPRWLPVGKGANIFHWGFAGTYGLEPSPLVYYHDICACSTHFIT
ncbi:hypothetical protein DEU56DRAFT_477866 [Suillus clintonianus]|uniref:uncharacterized protein n=1 Tax=Suillus clintonianus TaxID=1904413 RepID=UPI001B878F13|nr:uncharacterized protein DEU56DRAFT_477866 [Suillus clintonianus]KAG2153297.1 hypothetical protein DEU56DRAFT_477866 [Suillus clintonianus]